MGWYDIHTSEILYDQNGNEVVRRSGVYGGPFMLAVMVRNNLLKEAGLSEDTDVSRYTIKFGRDINYEEVEKMQGVILDPNTYLKIGDLVTVTGWTGTQKGEVQKIEGFDVIVITDDGKTITNDYTLIRKIE